MVANIHIYKLIYLVALNGCFGWDDSICWKNAVAFNMGDLFAGKFAAGLHEIRGSNPAN